MDNGEIDDWALGMILSVVGIYVWTKLCFKVWYWLMERMDHDDGGGGDGEKIILFPQRGADKAG